MRWIMLGFLWLGLAGSALAVGNDNSSLENDPEYRQAKAFVEAKQWNNAPPLLQSLERDIKNQPGCCQTKQESLGTSPAPAWIRPCKADATP